VSRLKLHDSLLESTNTVEDVRVPRSGVTDWYNAGKIMPEL